MSLYKDKAYPYPEVVTGEQWTVNELFPGDTAHTNNMDNQMTVPLDRECEYCGINHSRMIRRHELGHAKWSPKTKGKLKDTRIEAIEVLEEIRVNYLLLRNKLPLTDGIECEAITINKVTNIIEKGSIASIILMLLATARKRQLPDSRIGTWHSYNSIKDGHEHAIALGLMAETIHKKLYSDFRLKELEFAVNIAKSFHSELVTKGNSTYYMAEKISYRKVQTLAQKLTKVLESFMDTPNPEEIKRKDNTTEEVCLMHNNQEECDEDSENCDIELESTEETMAGGVGPMANSSLERRMRDELTDKLEYKRNKLGIGHWGKMEIHKPLLNVNLQSRLKNGRNYRAMEYGTNPKYIHRYCSDKKLFKQKQRVYGGTILIDASGSMAFNGQDILEIMKLLPAVTIAMYNGEPYYDMGNLRIIAEGGKRVSEEYLDMHSGGGNVIDGPALEWLSTQKPRRIWVSDMQVFGAGKNSDAFNLVQECYTLCTKHKIINLKDVYEVKEHALKLNMV